MRLNSSALGLLLPVAALLSGCGMGNSGSAISSAVRPSKAITGKAYGGQFPVASGTIAVYAFGNTGYGSGSAPLATVQAGTDGYFTIDPSAITCPTADTPVYILSIGGNPGFGTNSAILEGAGLGNCADAADAFVTITEISTAALAYTFAHFFSAVPISDDLVTNDHFGAPASATQTIINGNSGTLSTLLDVENGYPRPNTPTFTFESAKLITLGNILGNCVNSVGPSSPGCLGLFGNITGPGRAKPANTLEAAVYLALNPRQNVSALYALQPMAGGNPAYTGGLTSAPADWSLSASYTAPGFSLGVNTRTASTIDIDTAGRVWFPSNGPGQAGVGFFDPSVGAFSPLFTANLTHPQEVALDIDNYVWVNDSSSPNIAGFPASSPTSPVSLSIPGTTSYSLTVAYDNSLRYGIVAPDGLPALGQVQGKNTYTEIPGTEIGGGGGFIASSLAGDVIGGIGVAGQELRTPTTYDLYYSPNGQVTPITYQTYQDAGQVVFTGNNFIGTRGGYSSPDDGICIWSAQACFAMANQMIRHPSGLSIDGAGSLWLADQFSLTVEQIPLTNGSYLNSSNQANNLIFDHDSANGGTLQAPTGIAVDGAGNVWVSNYGCYGNGCTPGSFVLSEIIGLGAPTITPVSRQIVINNLAGTEPQTKTGSVPVK